MSVVDRAGSNRLKLQQQGFRLDMSLPIQFSSPSLSLGSFHFTDKDMHPTVTEKAVTVVNCLHYCLHMPTHIHGTSLLLYPYCSPACENVYLSHDLSLSLNICVYCCINRYWFSSFFLFLFGTGDCCLTHAVCL